MRHENNPFVSISDLMAGIVGAVVMLFVVSLAMNVQMQADRVRKTRVEKLKEEELAASQKLREMEEETKRKEGIDFALTEIARNVREENLDSDIEVDVVHRRIRLRNATFDSASACVKYRAARSMEEWSITFRDLLTKSRDLKILVEGHTDADKVRTPGTGGEKCAYYDDNFTLSAARAREARRYLTASWNDELKSRVVVAGYGETRPEDVDVRSPRNRRVDIRIEE